jgi:hypothetical protein
MQVRRYLLLNFLIVYDTDGYPMEQQETAKSGYLKSEYFTNKPKFANNM